MKTFKGVIRVMEAKSFDLETEDTRSTHPDHGQDG